MNTPFTDSGYCQGGSAAYVQPDSPKYELYVGAGGVTALLAGVGAILAGAIAGIRHWHALHGASGGSIPTSILSCGKTAVELLHTALDLQFGNYVDWTEGMGGLPYKTSCRLGRKFAGKRPLIRPSLHPQWREFPQYGLLGTRKLGEFIRQAAEEAGMGDKWPENFTTIATTRSGAPVLFRASGVFMLKDGKEIQLSDQAAPLSLAVRASCTIGGVMAPLEYKGHLLFDGCLSRDGFCPVGIPIRHYGSDPKRMIAVRCNEVHPTTITGKVQRFIRLCWGVNPDFHWMPETAGVIEIHPPILHISTLNFGVSRDEKWLAILLSFQESVAAMALAGILQGEKLRQTQDLIESLGYWRDAHPGGPKEEQHLSAKAEACFAQHGLY